MKSILHRCKKMPGDTRGAALLEFLLTLPLFLLLMFAVVEFGWFFVRHEATGHAVGAVAQAIQNSNTLNPITQSYANSQGVGIVPLGSGSNYICAMSYANATTSVTPSYLPAGSSCSNAGLTSGGCTGANNYLPAYCNATGACIVTSAPSCSITRSSGWDGCVTGGSTTVPGADSGCTSGQWTTTTPAGVAAGTPYYVAVTASAAAQPLTGFAKTILPNGTAITQSTVVQVANGSAAPSSLPTCVLGQILVYGTSGWVCGASSASNTSSTAYYPDVCPAGAPMVDYGGWMTCGNCPAGNTLVSNGTNSTWSCQPVGGSTLHLISSSLANVFGRNTMGNGTSYVVDLSPFVPANATAVIIRGELTAQVTSNASQVAYWGYLMLSADGTWFLHSVAYLNSDEDWAGSGGNTSKTADSGITIIQLSVPQTIWVQATGSGIGNSSAAQLYVVGYYTGTTSN